MVVETLVHRLSAGLLRRCGTEQVSDREVGMQLAYANNNNDADSSNKEESVMRKHHHIITLVALVVMVGVSLISPAPGILISQAHAGEVPGESQIIAHTLTAHQILCLSKDGSIETVFFDGKWLAVRNVELLNRTLILRTEFGSISLAAAFKAP